MRRLFATLSVLAVLAACGEAPPERYAPQASTGLRLLGTESDDGFARVARHAGAQFFRRLV